MLNIVIPMAGRGSRFAEAGYTLPKPLIDVGGRPMIEWVIENLRPTQQHRFIFICLSEHLEMFPKLENRLRELCPNMELVSTRTVTEGAACTMLLAERFINNDQPLMTANSDQIVEVSVDDYLKSGVNLDGLLMTFKASDPKWSYCVMHNGLVTKVVEKQVVSDEATVGIYNFKSGAEFVKAAHSMIKKDIRVNNEFYLAPVYNEMISEGKRIGIHCIGTEGSSMHGLGIPSDLDSFKKTEYFRTRTPAV